MNQPFFRRCLVFATLGAASLALTACGGGSGGEEAFVTQPQARASALGEPGNAAEAAAQRSSDLVAADAGAATQEPK